VTSEASATWTHRRDIDGLRAIAVASVVCYHAAPSWFPGGFAGVDVFFVISGYLIGGILLAELARSRSLDILQFYRRRVQRLFPALLVVLATTLLAGWFLLFSDEFEQLGKHVVSAAAFGTNLVLWQEAGYFDTASESKVLLHLWSLGIEEQFYFVFPLILAVSWRARRAFPVIAALAALSLAGMLAYDEQDPTWTFFLLQPRSWELLVGALSVGLQPKLRRLPKAARALLATAGVVAIVASVRMLDGSTTWPGVATLAPTLGTAAVILGGTDALPAIVLGNRPMNWLGLVSYPLYLWHWPLLAMLRVLGGHERIELRAGAVALSLALAGLTYTWIERPFRQGRAVAWKPIALVLAMVTVGVSGFATWHAHGFPARANNARNQGNIEYARAIQDLEDNCVERLGQPWRSGYCVTTSDAPTIAFLGDSKAVAAFAPIFLGNVDAPVLLLAKPYCVPFTEYQLLAPNGTDRGCDRFARTALDAIAAVPSIRTVVLFKRPTGWLRGVVQDGVATFPDGVRLAPKRPTELASAGEFFQAGLHRLVGDIEALDRRVVFLVDNPDLSVDPATCVDRPFSLSLTASAANCDRPRTELAAQEKPYLAMVARLATEHPSMSVFDSRPLFCDDLACRGAEDGLVLYRDRMHLNTVGAERLVRSLLASIAEEGG
jgi:peptidoglycan/LPS O-acetylase OafA/YrhL